MCINVIWDDPDHTILVYRFSDSWDADDYAEAATIEWQLMDSVEHRVDTIMDLQQLYAVPDDLMAHIWNSSAHSHLKRGLLILLGERALTEAFAKALTKAYPEAASDILQVRSLHAARFAIATQYGKPPTRPQRAALSLS